MTSLPPARSCSTSRNLAGTASRPLLSSVSEVTPRNTQPPDYRGSPTIPHFFPLGGTIDKRLGWVKLKMLDFAFWTMTYHGERRKHFARLQRFNKNRTIEGLMNVTSRIDWHPFVGKGRQSRA